jgi:hypothetical protein
MTAKSMLFAAMTMIGAVAASAQGTGPINVLGTIDHIDATSIAIKSDDGAVQTFKLAPNLLVLQNKPATLADIKPDDFVASAARRARDGKLHSTELRIFPPAMRGLGEGQRPMNDAQEQTMTNAVVTGAAVANGSNDLDVTFAGGKSELVVDPGVPVTRIDVVDRSLAKPGAKVRVQGMPDSGGGTVTRITVQ